MLRARLILSAIWWGWGLSLFVILAVLSSNSGMLDPGKAWGWFLPNIVPALTLMGAVALNQQPQGVMPRVRTPLLLISLGASIAYLSLMTAAVFSPFSSIDPIGQMLRSNLYLTPLQALTLSTVGIFFTQHSRSENEAAAQAVEPPAKRARAPRAAGKGQRE